MVSGVGDWSGRSVTKLKGALWGRGEMSMESGTKQGDDEGIGGVVTPSHLTGGVVVPSASTDISIPYYPNPIPCFLPRPSPS